MADIPGDDTTTAAFDNPVYYGASFSSELEISGDVDYIRLDLVAGTTYSIYGSEETPFHDIIVTMFDPVGGISFGGNSGVNVNCAFTYAATITGTYFVRIFDRYAQAGPYSVEVTGIAATDHLLTTGDDTYTGTNTDERILGGEGADVISVGAGLDALGEQGDDTLTGNGSDNFISGGTGIDTIHGAGGTNSLFGDAGNDVIDGGAGADRVYGGDGSDLLYGGDTYALSGDAGDNQIHGGAGDDSVAGNDGRDALWGDDGTDILIGLALADRLDGGAGADYMYGGTGNDTYVVDDAGDVVDELDLLPALPAPVDGVDTVLSSISFNLTADAVHVLGDIERLALTGSADIDGTGNGLSNFLVGNSGGNVLSGLDGIDNLFGRAGNDHLVGGDGNDALNGGDGADELIGGAGRDRLTGGADADTFVFTSTAESNISATGRDLILDFSAAEGDKIDLSAIDADSVTIGVQSFSFIGTAAFTHQAGELRYGVRGGNVYVYGDTDGDGHVDFSVLVNGHTSIQASDFVL